MRLLFSTLLFFLLSASVPATFAAEEAADRKLAFEAIVLRVQDGDSLLIRRRGQTRNERLRLSAIDAPERGQPHGDASRAALAALIDGEPIRVVPVKKDRYGRLVGRVGVNERDIGLAMLEGGHAWYFRRYRRDLPVELRKPYERAEARAREAGIGLWRDPAAQAPWRYRSGQRDQRGEAGDRARRSPS